MKRDEMNRLLREELDRIPRGSYEQNVLRAIYNMQRRSDIARDPLAPAAAPLTEAVRLARKDDPTFQPTFDRSYFGL